MVSGTTNRYKHPFSSWQGFTLLEVMIAMAIIAIGLVTLFGAQSWSLSRVTEAKFNTVAPLIASTKAAELAMGQLAYADGQGDAGVEYPGYRWQLKVEDVSGTHQEALAGLGKILKKVILVVTWSKTRHVYTLTYYVRRNDRID